MRLKVSKKLRTLKKVAKEQEKTFSSAPKLDLNLQRSFNLAQSQFKAILLKKEVKKRFATTSKRSSGRNDATRRHVSDASMKKGETLKCTALPSKSCTNA